MNLGKFEEAEEIFMDALRESKGALTAQAALYFYYRLRGKLSTAAKYEAEALSLETIDQLKTAQNHRSLIDPNFSYFATRKPSNSLMKMVGSGMVMRTKTKKTKGLQLKRRRGPSKLSSHSVAKVRRTSGYDEEEDSGMSDFIISDEEDGSSEDVSDSETRKLNARAVIILSSSDSDSEPVISKNSSYSSYSSLRTSNKKTVQFGSDSPLLIRTGTLDTPFPIDSDSSMIVCSPTEALSIDFEDEKKVKRCISRVIVRFKKGMEVLIPIERDDFTVRELISTAQMRFNRLFPEEAKHFGKISALSSSDNSAMLFPDDRLASILSADSEVLQAHFNSEKAGQDSPSKMNSIEEDFRRKLQILNLKPDGISEIKSLKTFQDRFRCASNQILDLSALSLDSQRFSEYAPFINKFHRQEDLKLLNLSENLLVDEDLRNLGCYACKEINLSMNFLQRPSAKMFKAFEFVDLSYNPIDVTWLLSNMGHFNGMNLIGCFELLTEELSLEQWSELGRLAGNLRRLKISLPPANDSFFANLCGDLEELELFGVDLNSEALVALSYLEKLKSLAFTACTFNRSAVEGLCKVLKRTSSLERLLIDESELDWQTVKDEGIRGNFTLKQVIHDGSIDDNL